MKELTLQAFKKANKQARERMATKRGKTVEQLLKDLRNPKAAAPAPKVEKKASKASKKATITFGKLPVIHNVHILDASGSMSGDKIQNAVIGINNEILELKKDTTVEYTQTIVSFSGALDIKNHMWKMPIQKVNKFSTHDRGMTALNDATAKTLSSLLQEANGTDKVLIKIFTDGGENASRQYGTVAVAELIKECENKGFTVTFVGTAQDVETTKQLFSIHDSNTLVHDNTAKGVAEAYRGITVATMSFAENVKAGKQVTKGFYKKVGKL